MKVVALVGESGSGKSFRAQWVAKEQHLDYILDDGLLIYKGHIVAGKSAKSEKTMIASVKHAIFMYDKDALPMRDALRARGDIALLLLGTSEKMVQRIAQRLELPPPEKIIFVTDIATPEEIALAKQMRETQGKHVIPAPTFEVKKHLSGYFLDSLKVFFRMQDKDYFEADKTIIRPTYSYMGDYKLTPKVVTDIAKHEADKVPGVTVKEVRLERIKGSVGVSVDIDVALRFGLDIRATARMVQQRVRPALEDYAALTVAKINIKIVTFQTAESGHKK